MDNLRREFKGSANPMVSNSEIQKWKSALGKIPSGLFVVTVFSPQGETGFLASWIQQCSFNPPLVTIAVNNQRPMREWLSAGQRLVVNLIPEGGKALVAHFGKGFAPGESAFEGLGVEGCPPRLKDALAWLEVRVTAMVPTGDHSLVVAEVIDGEVLQDGKPTVHIRRDGMKY